MTAENEQLELEFEEPFENDLCPAWCSVEHDEPEPDNYGQWTCPDTGTIYVRNDGDWEPARNRWGLRESTYVECADEWYIDPYDYGYRMCDSCGEWDSEHNGAYDRHGDYWYCEWHADEARGGGCGGDSVATCAECRSRNVTHYHPVSESLYCAEHAPTAAHTIDSVLVAA